ncbi:MAG: hypothetical protein IAF38_15980 [Bacteroidia bacterium]|nr:hypothetical protein [Bacteroidia bacterium]
MLSSINNIFGNSKKKKTDAIQSAVVAYSIRNGKLTVLNEVPEQSVKNVQAETNGLVLTQGFHKIGGSFFYFEEPGLYFFSFPFQKNSLRIVVGKDAIENALLISNTIIRGNKDDEQSLKHLKKEVLDRFLVLTCTYACIFVQHILNETGIKSRLVMTLTAEEENQYNDGHTLLEVYDTAIKKYVLVDIDKKCVFESDNGEKMDLLSFTGAIKNEAKIRIVSAAGFPKLDWAGFCAVDSGFNFQFIEQMFCYDEQQQLNLYKRICNLPVIMADNKYFSVSSATEVKNSWKNKLNFLPVEEFRQKFYPL